MAIRADDIDLDEDRHLVERFQTGDRSAFDELYRRHFHRLRGYCVRRVGDVHDAEEIAQEAFVRALQALPRFAGERRFYPWMTVIAARLCVDHHRRRSRVRPSDEVDPGTVDTDPHAGLAWEADVADLDAALQRLGPRHREVLALRERGGMSYAEIADRLEVPQTTVEARLFRARKALRREFAAVTGDGRLGGIPLIGWVSLRLGRLRHRVGDHLPELTSLTGPVAAGAMAATLVFGPALSGGGSGGDVTAGRPVPAAAVAAAPSLGDTGLLGSSIAAGRATNPASVPGAADSRPEASPARPLPDPATVGAPRFGIEGEDGSGVDEGADEMPVSADVGPVVVGIDPAAVPAWLDETNDHIGGRS